MRSPLAITGGTPVRLKLLPYGKQWIEEDDIESVVKVLRSDWLTTGPAVARFEEEFAAAVGATFAVAVSSGTAALHAATFASGVGPGDEVIVPALTFAASANCVRYMGGTVVFADVRRDTLNLDPARVEASLTTRTRAIVTVDYAGQPSDIAELRDLADRRNLVLIEDACHALGATYRGRCVGGVADFTAFSLHPVKLITCGEGGVVTTESAEQCARLRSFRNHGISTDHRQREAADSWHYEMVDLGYNYRLTDFQCALAQSQLRKLPGWLDRRRHLAAFYQAEFGAMPELEVPTILPDRESGWHLYAVRLNLDKLRVGRTEIFRALRAENIGVNVHYVPVPWHPYYQKFGYRRGEFPIAEREYERLLSLPLWPGMTDSDAEDVVRALKKVLEAYRK